ncbi:MAG: citrate synthase/methylcitrate synthase [Chloroflexi bacterium]|nr:citrate synthase/methylcitrate synthase [Chloroflexota bacterium]
MTTGSTASGKPARDPATSGLEGVVVARTELSDVDGQKGVLTIRGYSIEELSGNISLEEAAYLLWHGSLPTRSQLDDLHRRLVGYRRLPEEARVAVQAAAKRMQPMDALRFAVGSLTVDDPHPGDNSRDANLIRAEMLVSRVPVIVGTYQRLRTGGQPVEPRADLGIVANLFFQMSGEEPDPAKVKGLETYLVTVTDHGMNASTFTARVIASTDSDMFSAVTGAIGALKGPLHGGAPGPALDMIEEIGSPENAEAWMKDAVAKGKRLMGFGHRVYKVRDPRAEVLYKAAEQLAGDTDERQSLALAREVERVGVQVLAEAKPGRNLNTNVEFYTALLLRDVGLSSDLFSPAFGIGRTVGWTAHVIEQQEGGRLIRPQSEYVGPRGKTFIPIGQR